MSRGKVLCHDGSPFCNYKCPGCGYVMHVHLSQLPHDYRGLELRTFCKKCHTELVLPHPVKWTGEKERVSHEPR